MNSNTKELIEALKNAFSVVENAVSALTTRSAAIELEANAHVAAMQAAYDGLKENRDEAAEIAETLFSFTDAVQDKLEEGADIADDIRGYTQDIIDDCAYLVSHDVILDPDEDDSDLDEDEEEETDDLDSAEPEENGEEVETASEDTPTDCEA